MSKQQAAFIIYRPLGRKRHGITLFRGVALAYVMQSVLHRIGTSYTSVRVI